MLMPSCANEASPLSNTQPEPNWSVVTHSVSRTLTTNQPSPDGESPAPASSSRASGIARVYPAPRAAIQALSARAAPDDHGTHLEVEPAVVPGDDSFVDEAANRIL